LAAAAPFYRENDVGTAAGATTDCEGIRTGVRHRPGPTERHRIKERLEELERRQRVMEEELRKLREREAQREV
jgi:hypothetical protein